jgi:RimJ/RimL family protein N-acetyltransferase
MRWLTRLIRSVREAIRRLRRVFADLDFAQRRRLEIQTGLVLTPETERANARAQIAWLNALYACERYELSATSVGNRNRSSRDPLAWLGVPEVRLRRWRMSDLDRVALMTDDEYLRPWWWMADELPSWLRREIAEERGPTRAICLPDDDRVLGRVAVRLPEFASDAVRCAAVRPSDQPAGELSYWLLPAARGRGLAFTAVTEMINIAADAGLSSLVLDIEEENAASIRVAEHLGAERRAPTRLQTDRFGHDWTMVVYVLPVR